MDRKHKKYSRQDLNNSYSSYWYTPHWWTLVNSKLATHILVLLHQWLAVTKLCTKAWQYCMYYNYEADHHSITCSMLWRWFIILTVYTTQYTHTTMLCYFHPNLSLLLYMCSNIHSKKVHEHTQVHSICLLPLLNTSSMSKIVLPPCMYGTYACSMPAYLVD